MSEKPINITIADSEQRAARNSNNIHNFEKEIENFSQPAFLSELYNFTQGEEAIDLVYELSEETYQINHVAPYRALVLRPLKSEQSELTSADLNTDVPRLHFVQTRNGVTLSFYSFYSNSEEGLEISESISRKIPKQNLEDLSFESVPALPNKHVIRCTKPLTSGPLSLARDGDLDSTPNNYLFIESVSVNEGEYECRCMPDIEKGIRMLNINSSDINIIYDFNAGELIYRDPTLLNTLLNRGAKIVLKRLELILEDDNVREGDDEFDSLLRQSIKEVSDDEDAQMRAEIAESNRYLTTVDLNKREIKIEGMPQEEYVYDLLYSFGAMFDLKGEYLFIQNNGNSRKRRAHQVIFD